MKAYDICLFFILINACMALFGEMGVFPTGEQQGQYYTSETDALDNDFADFTSQPSSGGIGLPTWLVNPFSLTIIIAGVILGGMGGLSLKATTPQVVGIVVFAAVFWGAWAATNGIMGTLGLPDILVGLLLAMHWWVFIAGVVQLATGTSFDNMA